MLSGDCLGDGGVSRPGGQGPNVCVLWAEPKEHEHFVRVPGREDRSQMLVPTFCRADLGWNFYFGPANLRKIAGEFFSEVWWRILIANFSALFFQGFRPPEKFTPKIHVQNCRHSSPISLSRTQNLFTAIFCLGGGDQQMFMCPFWPLYFFQRIQAFPWLRPGNENWCKNRLQMSGAREPPHFWKKGSENLGWNLASNQFRESLRELLREWGFRIN